MAKGKTLPLIATAVVGVVAIIGIRAMTSGGDDEQSKADGLRPECTAFTVVASSEKAAMLSNLADDYNTSGRTVGGECYDAVVSSLASGTAEAALAAGWDPEVDGPAPTAWTPASSTWVKVLEEDLARNDRPTIIPDDYTNVASTPLVLAMPQPMAKALGWPRKALGWSDVLDLAKNPDGWKSVGHPEWGQFTLGKTNPTVSTSGLAATVGAFVAATGRSSDLTAKDLSDPKVRAYVSAVERSVVHYGDTTLTFLSNLQQAADAGQPMTYVSAVAVEEKSVIDYNLGNPTGDPRTLGKGKKPKVPLVAIYPKEGTLNSDNPYVVLDAEWVSEEQKAGAADFAEFLRTKQAQKKFTDAGFRTYDGKAGAAVKEDANLTVKGPELVLSPPAPKVMAAVRETWAELRKPARVLMVVDVSGSMGEPAGGGRSKLELAQSAAAGALGQFTKKDEVGLWAFTTGMGAGNESYSELAPMRPLDPAAKRQMTERLASLVPLQGTPLYGATRAAAAKVRDACEPGFICAVVVLTDGRNEDPQDNDLDSLLKELGGGSSETPLRVFSIAYGEGADLATLKRISEASRAAAYDSRDASRIDKVFVDVLSNF